MDDAQYVRRKMFVTKVLVIQYGVKIREISQKRLCIFESIVRFVYRSCNVVYIENRFIKKT